MKQTEYDIKFDEFNDVFYIDGEECVSSKFLLELLNYIAIMFHYEPKMIYSESHYRIVLEEDLNIKINLLFDY